MRALLTGSNQYQDFVGSNLLATRYPDLLGDVLGQPPFGGGSLWITKLQSVASSTV